jgi:hypothetical protein
MDPLYRMHRAPQEFPTEPPLDGHDTLNLRNSFVVRASQDLVSTSDPASAEPSLTSEPAQKVPGLGLYQLHTWSGPNPCKRVILGL